MLRRSTAIAIISGAAVLAGTSVAAGFGTFRRRVEDDGAAIVYQVAVADVNGDGKGDAVAAVDAIDEAREPRGDVPREARAAVCGHRRC